MWNCNANQSSVFLLHSSLSFTGGPKVYDVTKYLDDHPGGGEIMLEFAGICLFFL
jgi:hypothetical protein